MVLPGLSGAPIEFLALCRGTGTFQVARSPRNMLFIVLLGLDLHGTASRSSPTYGTVGYVGAGVGFRSVCLMP